MFVDLEHPALEVASFHDELERHGVRLWPFGSRRLRAITHLDVDDAGVERAVRAIRAVAARSAGAHV